jgi:hypothetical protein
MQWSARVKKHELLAKDGKGSLLNSRQAIRPVALRVNANLIQTDLCLNPTQKRKLSLAAFIARVHCYFCIRAVK